MLTRKWMRVLIVLVIVFALARVCLRLKAKVTNSDTAKYLEIEANIRIKSGAKKRIPPDSNYTETEEFNDRDFHTGKNNQNESNIKAKDTWRSRKFVDPAAFDHKVIDPKVEAALWMEVTNHSAPQLEQMRANADKPWTANRDQIVKFRAELEELKTNLSDFVLTQRNTWTGKTLKFSLNTDAYTNITSDVVNSFPKEQPISNLKKLPLCSVVGSSGVLIDSSCGKEIDKSDFVFRCNIADLAGYEEDVGRRSNFTTLNTVSIIAKRYNFLESKFDIVKFVRKLQEFNGYLWMPIYGLKSGLSFNLHTMRVVNRSKELPDLQVLVSNPDHFSAVQDFWRTKFNTLRISTGFYLASLALSMCEETHLFGFWPFSRDLNLRPVSYHYYDDMPGPLDVHSFSDEFRILLDMHEQGLLKMHYRQCL